MFDLLVRTSDGEEAAYDAKRGNGTNVISLLKWQYMVPFFFFAIIPYILIFVLFGMISNGNESVTNNVT